MSARWLLTIILPLLASLPPAHGARGEPAYPWLKQGTATRTLRDAVQPPPGFQRRPASAGSFAHWLRHLPVKPAGSPVMLYDGRRKPRQDAHAAVIDIDVGSRDLQQCADAVMRLRAEWLYASGRSADIAFDYTSGGRVPFSRWARGERPSDNGKRWSRRAQPDAGYASFRKYLTQVFIYAGTYSLSREMEPVRSSEVRTGDVFIKGGFPGHAVLVADVVEKPGTGERRFLLIQSYMPAQDMHVLKNPASADGSPWYPERFSWPLSTPEWSFLPGSHKRWPGGRS
ncbi:MAG: DUF4846 domain-containing protein [Hyphomicrobiaceae bacterium]